MTFGFSTSSAAPSVRVRRDASVATDDASMDEILASIRKIIDEGSAGASSPRQLAPPAARSSAHAVSPTAASAKPVKSAAASLPHPAATYQDDVLAELLEPETAIAVLKTATSPAASLVVDSVPAAVPAAVVEVAPARVVHPPAIVVVPPAFEMLTAEAALGALAAGLAQSTVVVAEAEPALVVSDSARLPAPPTQPALAFTPPSGSVADDARGADELQSPAAAAAAAVAEVAAANALISAKTVSLPASDASGIEGEAASITGLVSFEALKVQAVSAETAQFLSVEPVVQSDVPLPPANAEAAPEPGRAVAAPGPSLTLESLSSLEDTVAVMLRPLLREWLDANMPRMVEKALQQELRETGGRSATDAPQH